MYDNSINHWLDNTTCEGGVGECNANTLEYYGYLCLQLPITVMGFIFNGINIITFTIGHRNFQSWGTLHAFLCVLSVVDFCYMIFIAPFGLVLCVLHDNWYINNIYLIYIYKPLTSFCATCSVWITMTIAVDRYASIKNVMWRKMYTRKYAKFTLVFIIVASIGLNMPYYFIQRVQKDAIVIETEFGSSDGYVVYNYIRSFLAKYIPMVIVTWASIALCMALLRHKKKQSSLVSSEASASSKRQHWKRLSMILGISLMLVACQSFEPLTTPPVAKAITGNECVVYTETHRSLAMLAVTLETLSYASNFIFYFMFNRVMRETWMDIMNCKHGKNSSKVVSVMSTQRSPEE